MTDLYSRIEEAAAAIRAAVGIAPRVGVILGTGLGGLARRIRDARECAYDRIPHFVRATSASHAGRLAAGELSGVPVVAMEGRFHFYEGHSIDQVVFPVRVLKALGCDALIVTNACGAVNPQYAKGDILIIDDHINLMGVNPLIGPNDERLGPRHPDMCRPYAPEFVARAEALALKLGIRAHKGVYAAMTGPCLETRAEYRMLRLLGADAIGMSTAPEVIVAAHAGLKALGLGVLTDLCLPDALEPCKIEEIIAVANDAGPRLERLIVEFLDGLPLGG